MTRPAAQSVGVPQAGLRAALIGALFFLFYGSVNAFTASRGPLPSLYLPWETEIPFVAWAIVPYMSLDLLFAGAFLLCRDRRTLNVLSARILFALLFSTACFVLIPLQFGFARPATDGLPGLLFAVLSLDLPYNQFPSLHISLGLIVWQTYRSRLNGHARRLAGLWFALIAASTLLTYQHHTVDLAGGALVGLLALHFFPEGDTVRTAVTRVHLRMGLRYAALAVLMLIAAAALRGWAWLLAYPALSCLLVTAAYLSGHAGFTQKRDGCFPWVTVLLLEPWLVALKLSWSLYGRLDRPWHAIDERVLLGRRPAATEGAALLNEGVTAILDLCPEMSNTVSKGGLDYRHIPVLDFTAPTPGQLDEAVDFVQRHSRTGKVYVHCALGYARSAGVVAAWLMREGMTPQAACATILGRRRKVVRNGLLPQAAQPRPQPLIGETELESGTRTHSHGGNPPSAARACIASSRCCR